MRGLVCLHSDNWNLEPLRRALAAGEDPNERGNGSAAIFYAVGGHAAIYDTGREEIGLACVEMLLAAGATPNPPLCVYHEKYTTPLQVAARRGYAKILGALIRAGAELEVVVARKRKTALHIAAQYGRYDCVAALVAAGADVDARDSSARTPLDWARQKANDRVYPLLLRAGARIPSWLDPSSNEPYLPRVVAAGGFRAYEKRHLAALVSTFAPKFNRLPNEMVGVVMMFYAHVGFY